MAFPCRGSKGGRRLLRLSRSLPQPLIVTSEGSSDGVNLDRAHSHYLRGCFSGAAHPPSGDVLIRGANHPQSRRYLASRGSLCAPWPHSSAAPLTCWLAGQVVPSPFLPGSSNYV